MTISYERDNLLRKQADLIISTDSLDEEGNFEWLGTERQWNEYAKLKNQEEREERDKMMPF